MKNLIILRSIPLGGYKIICEILITDIICDFD